MKNAEKITNLKLRLQYGLLSAMLFVTLLQMITDGVFCSNEDLVAFLIDWFDIADLLQIHDNSVRLFSFIWKSNARETIEILLFLIIIPTNILEYIRLYNLFLEIIAYQLSACLSVIPSQLSVHYKSQFIISFHKAARTINSAVIAVP